MNESLGGMSEERLMEILKNAHKQCIVISPKKQKSKTKKQKTRKQNTKKQKTNVKRNKKRNKTVKKINKKKNKEGGMLSVMAYYNPNYKKIKKNKKNKSLARKFKVRSSYSQKKRKTKRFRPKLKIINESKTMSGGGKYLKSKSIKKTGKIKNKNKKGGYDSSISRAQAREMQRQQEQQIREEQLRVERLQRLREQSREQRRKRVISDANRLFPERSYIYPDDYNRAERDIEDHRLHERIMRTSVLPRATEVPLAVTPSRNMFSRYIGTPLSRMFNRTRRRRGRIQPEVVNAIPIASTVYEGNYLDDI